MSLQAPQLPALGAPSQTVMLGNVPFTPASALQQPAVPEPSTQVIDSLAGYIDHCWQKAKEGKQVCEQEMMSNLRQRNGVYEPEQEAAIAEMGGSSVYVLLTATKCRSAEAWLNDLLRPVGERPWAIKPTPQPDLPPDVTMAITSEMEALADEVVARANAVSMVIDPAKLKEELREFAEKRRSDITKELQEEAEKRAELMSVLIDDQLVEGNWHHAFWAVISDLVTLKAGILKGPVLKKRKVQSWGQVNGKWAPVATDQIVPEFSRVSPFDLYPAPDSRHPNDGYLIERHQMSRAQIQALLGVPGYNDANIRKALQDYRFGLRSTLSIDSQRAPLEFSGNYTQLTTGEKIEALEFWGAVQGKMLIDWGLKDATIDPDLDYEINAWKVGSYVIKAILNPDKLGRKPYSVESYERIPGSFWGRGIPDLMGDNQNVCNALARAVVNNAQIASGPLTEIDVDRCGEEDEQIHAWKIFKSTGSQLKESPAVRFTNIPCIVEPLLKVFEFFSSQSEDATGIPRWAYGNASVGGAGGTSSGLSMLMTQASRGIKEVVSHIDSMVEGCIERLYDYNMIYSDDDSVKGDAKIVARGSSALLAKEQRIARTNEFLRTTNNPTDLQIIGLEGRAELLKEAAAGLEIPVDNIIPDKDGLKELIAKVEAQQAAMISAGQNPGQGKGVAPSATPQTLDAAGKPAGGVESNMFQNQPGDTTNGQIGEAQ